MLEFDYFLYEVHDGKYGSLRDDGSWDGITRDIMQEVSRSDTLDICLPLAT